MSQAENNNNSVEKEARGILMKSILNEDEKRNTALLVWLDLWLHQSSDTLLHTFKLTPEN